MNAMLPGVCLPRWAMMWSIAFGLYATCKAFSWTQRRALPSPLWKRAAYLVAWPGMDPDMFLATPASAITRPARSEWLAAVAKAVLGIAVLGGALRLGSPAHSTVAAWIGMSGLILALHFGLFHLLSCGWRQVGLNAVPIMNRPLIARSLAEFWGKRWNLAFRDLTHQFVFRPLLGGVPPACALLLGFFVSGLIHDLVISIPAGGGYGWPTAYFLLQGLAVLFERSPTGRMLGLGGGRLGWIYCFACVVLPCGWLFPAVFVQNVIGPFLSALGGA